MKLRSETIQTLILIKNFHVYEAATLKEACEELNLNFDMVQRGMVRLHKKGLIKRDSRGAGTKYELVDKMNLGDFIEAIEGLNFASLTQQVKALLNFQQVG